MSDSHINVCPISCQLSNLTVFTTHAKPEFSETVLQNHCPFSLAVTVEFLGPGAIALMPLRPTIQVEFYAKSLGPELAVVLGNLAMMASPGLLTYTPTLTLGAPQVIGLQTQTIYRIGAVLRVGAPDEPSLINGFTEALTIEIYAAPEDMKSMNKA